MTKTGSVTGYTAVFDPSEMSSADLQPSLFKALTTDLLSFSVTDPHYTGETGYLTISGDTTVNINLTRINDVLFKLANADTTLENVVQEIINYHGPSSFSTEEDKGFSLKTEPYFESPAGTVAETREGKGSELTVKDTVEVIPSQDFQMKIFRVTSHTQQTLTRA